jgi:hypothetical protein
MYIPAGSCATGNGAATTNSRFGVIRVNTFNRSTIGHWVASTTSAALIV